jgi:hypothetical protein
MAEDGLEVAEKVTVQADQDHGAAADRRPALTTAVRLLAG